MRHLFTAPTFPTRWYPSVDGDVCPAVMGRLASLNLIARQEKSG